MTIYPSKGKRDGLALPADADQIMIRGDLERRISMRAWQLGMAVAALMTLASGALAHHSRACRPYTVEKVCSEAGRPCHLHMVYAPGHNPAGSAPDGYWYSAKPRKTPHVGRKQWKLNRNKPSNAYATCRELRCWFKHPPEHRY